MKRIKGFGILIFTFVVCAGIIGSSALAEEGQNHRSSRLSSKGSVEYADGIVIIDSSDLTYLADQIDGLERAYKIMTMDALNQIGTYYISSYGDISHNPDDNNILSDRAVELTFRDLHNGILGSQSVGHLAGVQAKDADGNLLYYADESAAESHNLIMTTTESNNLPILIGPAAANNLTAGTAAWVDGKLIVGNGADNQAFYNKGYTDGFAEKLDGLSIEYIYHEHVGDSSVQGGCYTVEQKHYGVSYNTYFDNARETKIINGQVYTFLGVGCRDCGKDYVTNWCEETQPEYSVRGPYPAHVNCPGVLLPSTWDLGCGKSTWTIESAVIVFP